MARRPTARLSSLEPERTRPFDRVLKWGAGLAVIGAIAWSVPQWSNAWRWMTGREPLYQPEHPAHLDEVDLDRVHRRLLGDWLIAADAATPGTDDPVLAEARKALQEAIAADQNLVELFEELDTIVTQGGLATDKGRSRALWLTRAWSQYLSDHDLPYFVHANVVITHRQLFYAHMYRVVASTEGTVGDEAYRVRALSRLDNLNLRELYLGYASNLDEGALLITDRVVELALDRVWPMLAPEPTGDRLQHVYAGSVASEARRALPGSTIATLGATAKARAELVAAYEAMVQRRDCSRFWVKRPGPKGYDDATLDDLVDAIDTGPCAGVKPSEMKTLRQSSATLQAAEGLDEALERLVAWVARPVAVHELRHVADDDAYDVEEGRPCDVCRATDPAPVRAEVAAYAAELAWSDAPALALYQVCETTSGEMQGTHARARSLLTAALGWDCEDGVPAELTETVRALEADALEVSDPISLGDGFPERLPLSVRDDGDPPPT